MSCTCNAEPAVCLSSDVYTVSIRVPTAAGKRITLYETVRVRKRHVAFGEVVYDGDVPIGFFVIESDHESMRDATNCEFEEGYS